MNGTYLAVNCGEFYYGIESVSDDRLKLVKRIQGVFVCNKRNGVGFF